PRTARTAPRPPPELVRHADPEGPGTALRLHRGQRQPARLPRGAAPGPAGQGGPGGAQPRVARGPDRHGPAGRRTVAAHPARRQGDDAGPVPTVADRATGAGARPRGVADRPGRLAAVADAAGPDRRTARGTG